MLGHRPYQPDQRHQDEARTSSRKEHSNFSVHVPPVGINSLRSHSTVGKVLVDALGGENWGFRNPVGVRGAALAVAFYRLSVVLGFVEWAIVKGR
jgi:hypothetical protein